MSQQATAAVTLQLQPLPGGTPRQGLLKFTVYAWTRDGPGYRSMFQQWDDFGAASARGGDAFSLRKTMKFLMKVRGTYGDVQEGWGGGGGGTPRIRASARR